MANVGSIVWLSKSQKDISQVFGIDFEAANGVSEAKFGYGNHLKATGVPKLPGSKT